MSDGQAEDERLMSIRRTMKTGGRMSAAAITMGLVLAVAGCGGGDGSDDAEQSSPASSGEDKGEGRNEQTGAESDEILAEVKGGQDITLTIHSAVREEGGFVTITGEVTNGGSSDWTGVQWKSDESELSVKNQASMAAAKLTDKVGKKRYFILRDTEGRCLCTAFQGAIRPGDSRSWYAQFPAPPEGNDKVDFQIADMPPAGIEISGGE